MDILRELAAARKRLLDLTRRNRLLNYRPRKARSIHVVDEIPQEIYGRLVLEEKPMDFLPSATMGRATVDDDNGDFASDADEMLLWDMPEESDSDTGRYTDRHLQTSLEKHHLQKRLFTVDKEARSILEEQGYMALFLAVGFLEWRDAERPDRTNKAPLILVPVELSGTAFKAAFHTEWTKEKILTNGSLAEKLAQQHVSLPDFEMPNEKAGITGYFDAVTAAIADKDDWRVLPDIWLDFFNFTKFVMYKDLDPAAWPEGRAPAEHPLIKKVLSPAKHADDSGSLASFSEEALDDRLLPSAVHHVMDADPSQIAVIEAIKARESLAVEGPPGTGKSQTITNVIAELLAAGKKVLFVSEKMAALEVVKERLDRVGLGDFCLELHSRKTKKKVLLEELRSSLASAEVPDIDMGHDFARLRQLRDDLNEYVRAIRTPLDAMGVTPFALFEWKEQLASYLDSSERQLPAITFSNVETYTRDDLEIAQSRIIELGQGLTRAGNPADNPWHGCRPGTILPADEQAIRDTIDQCLASISELHLAREKLTSLTGVSSVQTSAQIPSAVAAASIVASLPKLNREAILAPAWDTQEKQIEPLLHTLESYQELRGRLVPTFTEAAFTEEDLPAKLAEFRQRYASLLCFLSSRYRCLKREFRSWFREGSPKNTAEMLKAISDLARHRKLQEQLAARVTAGDPIGKTLFGVQWAGGDSDVSLLRQTAQWVPQFRKLARSKRVTQRALEVVFAGVARGAIKQAIDEVNACVAGLASKLDELAAQLTVSWPDVFGTDRDAVSWEVMSDRLVAWRENIPLLQSWSQYVARWQDCLDCIAQPVAEQAHAGLLGPDDLLPAFKGALADSLLHVAFSQSPALARFVGELHEQKISEFMALDMEIIEKNRQRLAHKLCASRPHLRAGSARDSVAGILHGQLNRRRGHMPIRKLLSTTIDIVRDIKPCFMMSPLSVAQFLDPKTIHFDVILFDEASQVRPEDAIGTLLRGEQVAVFGDTRQLPPTSFFDTLVNDEEEDGSVQTGIAQVESILHQCRMALPTRELNWHYRSRHESLIAVANQEFYDNHLLVYPSAASDDSWLGLKFQHVPETVYDRGRSATNRQEAKVIAKAVMAHFEEHPDKSLGVGAFSVGQQQAIWEEVELLLRARPDLEDFFKADRDGHFFVKNLETIQGDERDVIMISVGYGFDADRRLTNNFGPINNEGGERRLNVLITRARERCVVFSNFRASDLQLQPTSSRGLQVLKIYLDYAENGVLRSTTSDRDDTDSPFEDSVIDFLRSSGYTIQKQVGCAGFRVDIGVVHPDSPGRYLVGVECDGAKYHSSCVARDRDRLRQQVLEGLGWRIVRVWSTDWYRHRGETQKGLLATINRIRRDHHIEVSPATGATAPPETPPASPGEADVDSCTERDSANWSSPPLEDLVPNYTVCSSLRISMGKPLLNTATSQLVAAVTEVVAVEGPVHEEEVVRRIRTCWGLRRTGVRIHEKLEIAINAAAKQKAIVRKEGFCWDPSRLTAIPRKRNGGIAADLAYICAEEVVAAARLVLGHEYGTSRDSLVTKTGKVLGFQRVSPDVSEGIWKCLAAMIDCGRFVKGANGLITVGDN